MWFWAQELPVFDQQNLSLSQLPRFVKHQFLIKPLQFGKFTGTAGDGQHRMDFWGRGWSVFYIKGSHSLCLQWPTNPAFDSHSHLENKENEYFSPGLFQSCWHCHNAWTCMAKENHIPFPSVNEKRIVQWSHKLLYI